VLITIEKEPNSYNKCFAFASSALSHLIVVTSNSVVFVGGGARIFPVLRAQDTLITLCEQVPSNQMDPAISELVGLISTYLHIYFEAKRRAMQESCKYKFFEFFGLARRENQIKQD